MPVNLLKGDVFCSGFARFLIRPLIRKFTERFLDAKDVVVGTHFSRRDCEEICHLF